LPIYQDRPTAEARSAVGHAAGDFVLGIARDRAVEPVRTLLCLSKQPLMTHPTSGRREFLRAAAATAWAATSLSIAASLSAGQQGAGPSQGSATGGSSQPQPERRPLPAKGKFPLKAISSHNGLEA